MARGLYNEGRIITLDDVVSLLARGMREIDALRASAGEITYGTPLYASDDGTRTSRIVKAISADFADEFAADEKPLVRSYLAVVPWRVIHERNPPSVVDISRIYEQVDLFHYLPASASPTDRSGATTLQEAQQRARDFRRIFQAWVPSGRYRPTAIVESGLLPPFFTPNRRVWRTRLEFSHIEYPDDEILLSPNRVAFEDAAVDYPGVPADGEGQTARDLRDETAGA